MKVFRNFFLLNLAMAITTVVAHAQVAINEVDYNNPGTDDSEFVELVGRAGTVLDGWTLRGINAYDSGAVYADYVLQGTIGYDFDSAWGGQGGFFVIGSLDAETVARANAINSGTGADVNPNQGTGTGQVAAKTAPDFTPTNWLTAGDNIQNGTYDYDNGVNVAGDILQLWDGTPEASNLIDEWYYNYESGVYETGLSEPSTSYDSAGTENGTGGLISSIGRIGYSYGQPILVFDNATMTGMNLFDHETNSGDTWTYTGTDNFEATVEIGDSYEFTLSPNDTFTESTSKEIYWSGTDDYSELPAGPTPGTFNNASYGQGSQDEFTINILPEDEITIPGDTNGDNKVDQQDAQTVADNWGDPVSNGATDGDFNNDGYVNAIDASIMAGNWGDYTSESEANSVPEPGTIALLVFGLTMLLNQRVIKS